MKVYEIVTNRIIELLESGITPWNRPWNTQMPVNLVSKRPYRGVNVLMLCCTRFKSPYFLTFNQAKALGGSVKKGQKGLPVVFWNTLKVEEDYKEKNVPFMKYHTVFNVEQCEGITAPESGKIIFNPIERCEEVIAGFNNKPVIEHQGNQAFYRPSTDTITMPHKETFKSVEAYYATLFHEGVHATGHGSRLNRKSISEPHAFGSETYSHEELVAEIGSCFICGLTGIENITIQNQAGYIANWLKRLEDDKKLIITAASQAQKAVDFILNRKPEVSKP